MRSARLRQLLLSRNVPFVSVAIGMECLIVYVSAPVPADISARISANLSALIDIPDEFEGVPVKVVTVGEVIPAGGGG